MKHKLNKAFASSASVNIGILATVRCAEKEERGWWLSALIMIPSIYIYCSYEKLHLVHILWLDSANISITIQSNFLCFILTITEKHDVLFCLWYPTRGQELALNNLDSSLQAQCSSSSKACGRRLKGIQRLDLNADSSEQYIWVIKHFRRK